MAAIAANAQTITDELRRDLKGYGKIVINQSLEIERLVNNQPLPAEHKSQPTTTTTTGNNTANTPERNTSATEKPAAEKPTEKPATERPTTTPPPTSMTSASGTESEAAVVNTNKKIMRHSYKTTGYRIQVYSGGNKREDRKKCEEISARLKASFPNLPIYVHFYSPSWKCRAGNYTDHSEAQAMLKQIRAMGYSQACLVKGTINVQY